MVSFTTGPSGWVDRSRTSFSLNICNVCVGIVGKFIVGVRVCLRTTIVIVVIVGTIRVISGWVSFSFELTPLVSLVSWFLQWWKVGLGFSEFSCVGCCVTFFICKLLGAFKPFNSISFSRCDPICSYVPFSKCAWLVDLFRWGTFWHLWTARWSLERQLLMHLSQVSGVRLENQLISF